MGGSQAVGSAHIGITIWERIQWALGTLRFPINFHLRLIESLKVETVDAKGPL